MEGMEEKLNAILSDPELMQKISTMARSISPPAPPPPQAEQPAPSLNFDPAMLQRMSGMMGGMGVDKNQRALLSALSPYLSKDRIQKLENAMRAAKMAGLAANAVQRRQNTASGR